jgi:hypothetical protein
MNSKVTARTDYLFAMPSFWSGFARGIDLFGVFDSYNDSESDAEADRRALASDWEVVWQDLANALGQVETK